jgi:hypothetical protein
MSDNFNIHIQALSNLIRKVTPNIIANDICDVQPMTGPTGKIHTLRVRYPDAVKMREFELVDDDNFTQEGWCLIDVSYTVADWIITNPVGQWIAVESHREPRYIITEELFTMLALRFG